MLRPAALPDDQYRCAAVDELAHMIWTLRSRVDIPPHSVNGLILMLMQGLNDRVIALERQVERLGREASENGWEARG